MSLWLHEHDGQDHLSEAGAMNVWMIKEAQDGCKSSGWDATMYLTDTLQTSSS